MIKFYKNKAMAKTVVSLFAFALIITACFYACKKPTDGINLQVNTSSLSQSPVLIHFINANTASANQPGDFSVTVTGKDSARVVMDGGSINYKASHGFLPLSIKSGAKPSTSAPVTFNITANVAGFTPVTQSITLSKDSITVFDIRLVEYANPAPGTTALVTSAALTGGATTSTVTLNTPTTSSVAQNATLTIPTGTQMLDASGAVINANSLSVNVVQFAPGTPSIVNSFPGSMKATLALNSAGKLIPGGANFVTGGMLAINMTAGTTPVKSFSKPVSMSIELQAGTTNFANGKTVAVGDTIPLWSYNENTGVWKNEGTAVAYLDANNQLAAKANISHLSYWNLDWSWSVGYNTTNKALSINLKPSSTTNWSGLYEVQLQTPNGSYLQASTHTSPNTIIIKPSIFTPTNIIGMDTIIPGLIIIS